MKHRVVVAVSFCLAIHCGCRPTDSHTTWESNKSLDTYLEDMIVRPQRKKVELLALKYGVLPGAVSNFVADYCTTFPPPVLAVFNKSTNSLPVVLVPDKIQLLASRHGVSVQTVAAMVVDYEIWYSLESRDRWNGE